MLTISLNIDWELLAEQKKVLLDIMINKMLPTKEENAINGIIGLLDAMQDYAADVLGVYKFPEKEELE